MDKKREAPRQEASPASAQPQQEATKRPAVERRPCRPVRDPEVVRRVIAAVERC